MEIFCFKCSTKLPLEAGATISRGEECHKCSTDLRCCKMCAFYDPQAYNECRETSADRILEKEKANFCDYFKLGSDKSSDSSKNDALAAADALFKK